MPDLPGTAVYRARQAKSTDKAISLIIEHLREVRECGVDLRIELDQLAQELRLEPPPDNTSFAGFTHPELLALLHSLLQRHALPSDIEQRPEREDLLRRVDAELQRRAMLARRVDA